ncbi:hypothetical protein CVD28_00490 [Bacillus sp. M6-12]|uniref:hypothetical protein n=1 Tax=Bacillus sp. M6-12 TaxID=2054166 RepID=UPI000C76315A|nr:hypothetical protein [Bacillus sp. M6-12]PLS18912.1 hypothetical protein CVD28_00490 [Bacillus sp. M6-12]
MLQFKNQYFFVKPVIGRKAGDMEFDLFDMTGKTLGTNFLPDIDALNFSVEEKLTFLELIEEQTFMMAVMIKFAEEFGTALENWLELDMDSIELAEIIEMNHGFNADSVEKLISA